MALTNFIVTVAAVSAVVLLMRSDVKKSATMFRRNVRQIRHWLEEESSSAAKYAPPLFSAAKELEKSKPKEVAGKNFPEEKKD